MKWNEHYLKTWIRIFLCIMLMLVCSILSAKKVKAATLSPEDIDYTEIQKAIDDIMEHGNEIDFGEYIGRLMNGEEPFSFIQIGNQLLQSVKGEIRANLGTFGKLISIALIAAVFTNLTIAFKNNQVSETGYYIAYLLLFGLLISTFITASTIAVNALNSILSFMKALVPAYMMSIGFCTGATTSLVYYEAALMLITLVDFIIIKVVIPLINFYLIITLSNNLSKEDMLSKLAGLFSTIINWSLKSLLAAVVGFSAIQGLIVPVADHVKRSTIFKASEAIPGVGDALSGVTETIFGAGVLLKNAIGVAGLVVVLSICAVPFLKLLIITVIYKIGCAALQPISDKRIVECVNASAQSAGMLLQTVMVGAVLFLLSITIVAVTTNGSI